MKSQRLLVLTLFSFLSSIGFSQMAPDFTLTDSNGGIHRLYQDYLDQGKVVMLKIFFVNCPPCNAIAPQVQQKYVEWGSGNNGVQFIEISDKVTDNNVLVNGYKANHGITFPSVGSQGGGPDAAQVYKTNMFGQWTGTPMFIVIAPDGSVDFDVNLVDLDASITMAQQVVAPQPTSISLQPSFPGNSFPANISLMLHPANESTPMINLTTITNGTYQFTYPSAQIPEMTNPVITLLSMADAKSPEVSAIDLVAIRNHILGLTKFTSQKDLITADVNTDNKISVIDLVGIQKVILGLNTSYPNNTPSYVLYPSIVPLNPPSNGGGSISLDLQILKMGNVK